MPFGKWADFQGCLDDMKSQGKSDDSAKRICGSLQAKLETSNQEFITLTLDEMETLCPDCSKHMKEIGLKQVTLKTDYFKELNSLLKKFQDGQPPADWWDRCISSVSENTEVDDPPSLCGWIWYHHMNMTKGQPSIPEDSMEIDAIVNKMNEEKGIKKDEFGETVTIDDVEIFKSGVWNGDKYSDSDLDSLVMNFNKLSDKIKPPVKLGHSEDQDLLKKEGLPAAGWVSKLKRIGNTVMATLSDVPKKIADLIKRRAYKRVSAEIYPEFSSEGKRYKTVLRAVALLGGDIPAIESLADIQALYASDKDAKWYIFTLDNFKKEGGDITMLTEQEIQDLQQKAKQYDELKVELDGLKKNYDETSAELKKLQENNDDEDKEELKKKKKELEDKVAKQTQEIQVLTKKLSELEEKHSVHLAEDKKREIDNFIATAKQEGRILPKSEPAIRTLMEKADNTKVIKFTEKDKDGKESIRELSQFELIKSIVEGLPEILKFAEISQDGEITYPKEVKDSQGKLIPLDDVELAQKALKYAQDNKVSYDVAVIEISKQMKK